MNGPGDLRITIVIPVHATPPGLLADCLASVAASMGGADEAMIVVDGPQAQELEAVVDRAPTLGFRVVRNEKRLGLVGNWNECLRLAGLDLVHVMHADDAVDPAFHSAVRSVMADHDVGVVAAGRMPALGSILRGPDATMHLLSPFKPAAGSFVLRTSALGTPRRGFDPRYPSCPDEELYLLASTLDGIGIIEERLYAEARHDQQARFATWRRARFADEYYAARRAGGAASGPSFAGVATRETTRRLFGVGRQLCDDGEVRAARAIARSAVAHDKRSLIDWRFWALLGLAAKAAVTGRHSGNAAQSTTNDHWDERVDIGHRTDWFWDPAGSQHVARYLWAKSQLGDGDVLDVACGTGYGTAMLAAPSRRVLGIDLSADAIARATREFASGGVTFVQADAAKVPLASASQDHVVSFETIEHLHDPGAFVAEIGRVLRPDGTLLLSTPDRAVYSRDRTDGKSDNPYHPSEMTRSELLALLEPHFVVQQALGQGAYRDGGTPEKVGTARRWKGRVRATARRLAVIGLAPIVRHQSGARLLFPRVRRQHLPVAPRAGEYAYVVVIARKK